MLGDSEWRSCCVGICLPQIRFHNFNMHDFHLVSAAYFHKKKKIFM